MQELLRNIAKIQSWLNPVLQFILASAS